MKVRLVVKPALAVVRCRLLRQEHCEARSLKHVGNTLNFGIDVQDEVRPRNRTKQGEISAIAG